MTTPDDKPTSPQHRRPHRGRRYPSAALLAVAAVSSATSVTVVAATSAAAPATGSPIAKAATPPGPDMTLQQTFIKVVKAVQPSVVEIMTSTGLGSGVVFDAKGDIVTNAHVVGDSTSFVVVFSDGSQETGTLVGTYVPDDLAVVRVSAPKGLRPAHFANSRALEVGDIVLAMGNPLGLSSSVTEGIVSFNGRAVGEGNGVVLPDLVQTSAAINPGNSGGALVDLSGEVVGIPTLGASSSGTGTAVTGIGFAVPSDTVKLIAPQLIASGKVTKSGRASLGISGTTALSFAGQAIGVEVTSVQPGGPADMASIAAGDLITKIGQTKTLELADLQTALAELSPGSRVQVTLSTTSGAVRVVSVVLGDLAITSAAG
jgi:putative serine protease PepD